MTIGHFAAATVAFIAMSLAFAIHWSEEASKAKKSCWIVSWTFDSERPDNPIPPEFLPGKGG